VVLMLDLNDVEEAQRRFDLAAIRERLAGKISAANPTERVY
jgi:hypothetical protein